MRGDRLALALILLGGLLLFGGVAFPWVAAAAVVVGVVWYAAIRRRSSLATFSILVGVVSIALAGTIWLFFLAVPTAAVGLVLAAFSPRGRPRTAGFALNGLAFIPSAALVIWVLLA